MNTYYYCFPGGHLGGTIVVVAPDDKMTHKLALDILQEFYPRRKKHMLDKELELGGKYTFNKDGDVVYSDTGDY